MSSFLSSVLSSIGNGGGQSQAPSQSRPPAPTATSSATGPAAQPLRINGTNDRGLPALLPKRKAESDAEAARAKAPRKEVPPARPSPAPRTATSSPLPRPTTKPPVPSSSSSNTIPYRGTSQPSGPVNNARKNAPSAANPASKPAVSAGASKPVLNKSATTAAVKPASSAPPKKGSFQEIMARAKAAQEASRSVGAIKHKPVEKMSKKEKLAHEAEAKAKQGTGPPPRTVQKGQAKVPESKNTKPSEPEKKKSADLGYQGTMRPSPREPTYQGTMNKGSALKSRSGSYDRSRSASLGARPPPKRYTYYDEDDDMEEEEDYDSESDMEAGVFDVDREEQEALRIARREDELALKEEEELKRKKLERKKIMDAKKRRA
ncbi:hypothetical protein BKA80DRAFT_267043 [Phyllosticta citrichinensis]